MTSAHRALPPNPFKQALRERRPQIGLWVGLADGYVAELLASVGYDWLLIDAEHAPNDLRTILSQLQGAARHPAHAVVRPPSDDPVLIKQILELGVQTLLLPMVESAEQARDIVRATRYPPGGIRGVGSSLARASLWNQYPRYLDEADDQMCVLVQVESAAGLEQVEAIAAVDGVDGVFFGPADLSASLGLRGQPFHPRVQGAIERGLQQVHAAGKASGALCVDVARAKELIGLGLGFVGVGVDTTLLVRSASQLLGQFRDTPAPAPTAPRSAY